MSVSPLPSLRSPSLLPHPNNHQAQTSTKPTQTAPSGRSTAAPSSSACTTNGPTSPCVLTSTLSTPRTQLTRAQINLGLGDAVATFNISLTPELHNATGNGTLCIPKLAIPTGLVQEGTNASLQVVTFGQTGSALYNVRPRPLSWCTSPHLDYTASGRPAHIHAETDAR